MSFPSWKLKLLQLRELLFWKKAATTSTKKETPIIWLTDSKWKVREFLYSEHWTTVISSPIGKKHHHEYTAAPSNKQNQDTLIKVNTVSKEGCQERAPPALWRFFFIFMHDGQYNWLVLSPPLFGVAPFPRLRRIQYPPLQFWYIVYFFLDESLMRNVVNSWQIQTRPAGQCQCKSLRANES